VRFSLTDTYGLDPATLSLSAVVTGHGKKVVWPAVVLGVVQPGWVVEVAYTGTAPTRIDVVVQAWPLDFAGTYLRVEMVVEITSSAGVAL
jgi:hypothetical protein